MTVAQQILKIVDKLTPYASTSLTELQKITDVASEIGKSWSGSWLGYQSRVYYKYFSSPPAGARFDKTYGLRDTILSETRGDWLEFKFEDVTNHIYTLSGDIGLDNYKEASDQTVDIFDNLKSEALSIIHANTDRLFANDKFISSLLEKIEKISIYTESDFVEASCPRGQFRCSDQVALSQGFMTPPHIAIEAKIAALQEPYKACRDLIKETLKLYSHINNLEVNQVISERIGTNIFIGHGRSLMWRELKDFVQDKLHLPYDEFNRVAIAGVTNIARLSQMLDNACIAFIIMTAEDEMADGNKQARMNVIHEVGLFQGRLGFDRAIVLLEEGCEEFTNINGLGQLRFPKGKISAVFHDVREILVRENIIDE